MDYQQQVRTYQWGFCRGVTQKGVSFVVKALGQIIIPLTSETVEGLSLALQSVHNVHGSDSLTAGVLSVGDRVANHILKEDFENTASLFVDQSGDTFDTPTSSQTTNRGLGNTLDIVAQDFSVTLGTSLPKSFTSLSSARHVDCLCS